jgi:putative ABC transport system permease protein
VLPVFVESTTVTPGALLAALAVGLGATAVGAAVPALRAARTSPVEAMRDASAVTQRPSQSWVAGVLLLAGGVTFAVAGGLGRDLAISGAATLLVLLGAVLMTPLALALSAGAVRWVVRRIGGGLGDVAVMHVQRERSRSAYTMALLMVVLAAMLTLGTANSSLQNILEEWMDRRFGGDLLVYGPDMTEALRRELADVRGVAASTSFDFGSRIGVGSPSMSQNLILIDPTSFFDVAGFPWVDGSDDEARAALERGPSVLLPSRLAKTLDVERGDQVELASGSEAKTFDVAGIYATFGEGPQIGVVANIAERFFRAGDDRAVVFLDYTRQASHEHVLSRVEKILAPPQGTGSRFELQPEGFGRRIGAFFVITGAEAKEEARVGLNSFFRLFLAVILIAAIVGVLGMANTLTATVLQRFREIGILQAVGSTPRDVRRMVVVESAVLTFVALILSIGLGALLAWMFVKGASADIGFDVQLAFPWRLVPVLALVASVIALLAAAVPARRASRLTPVEALRYE